MSFEIADGKTHVGGRFWLVNNWTNRFEVNRVKILSKSWYDTVSIEATNSYGHKALKNVNMKDLKEFAFHKKLSAEAKLVVELLTESVPNESIK